VAGAFAGAYALQEGFLTCNVSLARPLGTPSERQAVWGHRGNAQDESVWSWPGTPAARGGARAGKATYLLLRDSIKGGQPTMWQRLVLTVPAGMRTVALLPRP
jgi:hypothetical protein